MATDEQIAMRAIEKLTARNELGLAKRALLKLLSNDCPPGCVPEGRYCIGKCIQHWGVLLAKECDE